MGATNQIKETNLSLKLEGKSCDKCCQKFTQQEIDERNFDFWFDTTNEANLIPMEQLAKVENIEGYDWIKKTVIKGLTTEYFNTLYFPFKQKGYQFSIWIRSIEHQDCPEKQAVHGELCLKDKITKDYE